MKKLGVLLLFCSLLLQVSCNYFRGQKKDIKEDGFLYVRTGAGMDEVLDSLSDKLNQTDAFRTYALSREYSSKIKAGKYKLSKSESNKELLNRLILGIQEEVPLMIGNEPTIFHLAGKVSKKIEADSAQIVKAIIDYAKKQNPVLDAETVKIYFLPNTYNFFWPTDGEQFVERMYAEFQKVWTEERQQKADEMGLSTLQVFTLASIVQMESSKTDEQPMVAQAYLNRLAEGMKLQADPTSVYAYKLQNGFNHRIQRVTGIHLSAPSEYNTYKVHGLPPAPICLPNLSAIDAVLNPEPHPYVYFCADPDRPGYHSFTNSYAEHQKNAAKYREWLESRGIR